MNCNQSFIKIFAALVFAVAVFSFAAPFDAFSLSQIQTASEPLARLFQLLFILFIISPPLIVVMLFLIWKELKKRNKMK